MEAELEQVDGRIFLSSDSTGRPGGFGSQDIWVSTRLTTSDLWSAPKNLGSNVNTPGFDGAPALSFDGTTLYFFRAVKRANGSVDNDLYVTTRTRIVDEGAARHGSHGESRIR